MNPHRGPADTAAQPSRPAPPSASEKTLRVLESALSHGRFTDIVQDTGYAKATTHRMLATLLDHEFLSLDAHNTYHPGPKILSLAGRAMASVDISPIAEPFVEKLVADVQCTVHIGMQNGDEVIYIVRSDSDRPYQMASRVGRAIPMHSSGIGKAILASWSDEAVGRFAARTGLPRRTAFTRTTLEQLLADINLVRERGYSLDQQENELGTACVGAPIRDHTGSVRYGLSISTILLEHSPEQVEAMSEQAISTAGQISRALGYIAG